MNSRVKTAHLVFTVSMKVGTQGSSTSNTTNNVLQATPCSAYKVKTCVKHSLKAPSCPSVTRLRQRCPTRPCPQLIREASEESLAPKLEKRVRFASSLCSTLDYEVNPKDTQLSWYCEDDYMNFQKDCCRTIQAFSMAKTRKEQGEKQYHLDGLVFTARGLEDILTRANAEARGYRKQLHAHHVLKQQFLQRQEGLYNPQWLRSISEHYSSELYQTALERGQRAAY